MDTRQHKAIAPTVVAAKNPNCCLQRISPQHVVEIAFVAAFVGIIEIYRRGGWCRYLLALS